MSQTALQDQAILCALAQHWKEAIQINLQIIKQERTNIDAHNRLGYAFMKNGQPIKSKEIFTKVLKLDPYNQIAQKNLKKISLLKKGAITDKTLWYISHINVVHERQLLRWAGVYDQKRAFFIDWDMWIRLAKFSKPFHLRVITCEHYIYLDENQQLKNTISSSHAKDPILSEKMHRQMFQRSFELLTSDDFVEIVKDWQVKYQTLEIRDKAIAELGQLLANRDRQLVERDRKIDALLASWSWRITSPLRWVINLVSRK